MVIEPSFGATGPPLLKAVSSEGLSSFDLGEAPFWPAACLSEPDSWAGHIPFAFWIVAALRPERLVELGTYTGNSYLAFCEAVKNLGLATACFAVDTWTGDAHAGFYGEDVYRDLTRHHDARYGAFSSLVRSTFDDAAEHFDDRSVDLLHIDGLHTYDAVAAYFGRWRAKLSSRAVVLFHDTNVRAGEFGVWRLWEELATQHPHFAFLHSHGLGVLGVGSDLPEAVADLLRATLDGTRARRVREAFARLGAAHVEQIRRQCLEAEVSAQRDHLETRDQTIERFRSDMDVLRQNVEHLQAELGRRGVIVAPDLERARVISNARPREAEVAEHLASIARFQREVVRLGKLVETANEEAHRFWAESERHRAEAEQLRGELKLAAGRLATAESDLGLARGRVAAMESSKFWKLRIRWFRLRSALGLIAQE